MATTTGLQTITILLILTMPLTMPTNVAQYVSVGSQISPGRADGEVGPSNNGTTVEIKVINPNKRSKNKLFTLRNVDCDKLGFPRDLNKTIFYQLGQNLISNDLTFDVGYYRGNKCLNILGYDNMQDVRKLLRNEQLRSFVMYFVVYGSISKERGGLGEVYT